MNEHILDILGIGSREDSYTNLIAYAFKHSSEFRQNILTMLGEQDYGDWKALIRPQIPIKSESGRKKDVPDLILFSNKKQKVLLIENKVFSGEGWEQTKRYASDEFKKGLIDYLKLDTSLEMKYFFLTLDDTEACSPSFKTISYSEISKCIPDTLNTSKLDILLKELRERIVEYYNWPPPNEDEIVLDYLKKTSRLVDSYKTFRIVTDNLLDGQFLKECEITGNRGSGYVPLCLWYKEKWRSKEYPEKKDGAKCYDIHFEFQWDTREDWENLTLYLHYHTNPYMTRNELKEVEEYFVEEYQKARDKFYNYIKEQSPPEWNISKTFLRIADYTFDKEIQFGDLKKKVGTLIENMTNIVGVYLNGTADNTA